MLICIGIANVTLWSGIILALLLMLVRDARRAEAQLERLEARLGSDDAADEAA